MRLRTIAQVPLCQRPAPELKQLQPQPVRSAVRISFYKAVAFQNHEQTEYCALWQAEFLRQRDQRPRYSVTGEDFQNAKDAIDDLDTVRGLFCLPGHYTD